ncbi:hypothetical protein [Kitasatospora mediocidica]|uniref:hypothetical protein n=1 Tax=Kitasatospora mediocidica TaxID=58352 RepID=UPI00056D94BB|nr:hypothetical protein [Kitasatospora mediocidica]
MAREHSAELGPEPLAVYTQRGLEAALRLPSGGDADAREIRLYHRQGAEFVVDGHAGRPIRAMGESDVTVRNGGRITVDESATVRAENSTVDCVGGYVMMVGGSARVSGGTVSAFNPVRPLICTGGKTYGWGTFTAVVSGGTFHSRENGTVHASGQAVVVATDGTVRANGGTVYAWGPASVYIVAGTVHGHEEARIDATGHGVTGAGAGDSRATVVGRGCWIKAGGTAHVTALAGSTVIATDSATVDADETCTVYTVGGDVRVLNTVPTPVAIAGMESVKFPR